MRFLTWLKTVIQGARENATSEDGVPLFDDESDIDPFNPFPDTIEHPLSDVIDLHTIPARDVKRVVEEYLHQAHEAGFSAVRIIHGKGLGVQRKTVRSILARSALVYDWTDAPPQAGGLGATIVRLSQPQQTCEAGDSIKPGA